MFKKFNSGILIIILAVLMIIYLIVRYSGSDDRTFRDKILSFDEKTITEILINDPKNLQGPVNLKKTGDNWTVSIGGRDYTADTNNVNSILGNLSELPTKRYAGKGKDVWVKYELTDSAAILVTLKESEKTVAEILVGKFAYNQPKGQQRQMQSGQQKADMTTYVRLADEKEVYATEGYLKMSVSGKVDAYRYRGLVNVKPADITRITVNEPGNRSVIENQDGKWLINGIMADSTKMAKYSSTISRLNGTKFVDLDVLPSMASHSVTIEGNNFYPVEINAYPAADTNIGYIITSSANPGSNFNGKEGGLFKKIWEN